MSSEKQPPIPEIKTLIPWGRVGIGVITMIARTSMAAAIGLALSIGVPLTVSAVEPPVMQEVGIGIEIAEADLPEEEKTKLLGIVGAKAKAAGLAIRDKIWDPDEALDKKTADLRRAQEEIAKLKKEVADARYKAGTEHEYIAQCARDTEVYLKSLREPSD